jgi:hypothetical protein
MKKKKKDGSAVAVVIAATSFRGFITEQLPLQILYCCLKTARKMFAAPLQKNFKGFKRGFSVGSACRAFVC